MSDGLSSWARQMLSRPGRFVTLATLSADGMPLQAVLWYAMRGDDVLVNSRVGRAWPTHLMDDARFSLMLGSEYEWLSLRGRAEVLHHGAQAQEDIVAMARVYLAHDPPKMERLIGEFRGQERISFLLHATAVTEHPDV